MKTLQKLPNGMDVYSINEYETSFLYKENFIERIYLKNGIELGDSPIIVDVGANIGMFSLLVLHESPDAVIYAFEPNPYAFNVLEQNLEKYGEQVHLFQVGLSNKEGSALFKIFPDYTILSSFHAVPENLRILLRQAIKNQNEKEFPAREELPEWKMRELVNNLLQKQIEMSLELRTLSSFIQNHDIQKIDLLKVDTEKCELQVLKGIEHDDWKKIQQVVLELHSKNDCDECVSLLNQHGFNIHVEQEKQFSHSEIFNCFALRA